jgi:hypothetical protein
MKKSILSLLREEVNEKGSYSLEKKVLQRAACKKHLDIVEKADRKKKFTESLLKLEERGKIFIENSIVSLKQKVAKQDDDTAAVTAAAAANAVALQSPDEVKISKKRKLKEDSLIDVPAVDIKRALAEKSCGKEEKILETPSTDETDSSPNAKKIYPPMEAQTGNNTILLFYAYCVPIMSRGDHPNTTVTSCTYIASFYIISMHHMYVLCRLYDILFLLRQ